MTRLIWRDGRFSWGPIGVLVFVTVSLLAFDIAWRVIEVQFDRLLIDALLVDVAAAAGLIILVRILLPARKGLRA